ncbi:alpha/beta family hydrolase [Nocardioides sp.]|uniref:alpha/beta hydrolase family protein n=1 Tax=Nocardioides sp. TaxID=35761 RepID=UPI002C04CE4C|nr:alpha/beta family hydrolase [Nocardioides sp.]HXH80580.1 alpha/beta family hydrolase [Nocardioides sp.]
MIKPVLRSIATPYGEGRLHVRRATSPIATLLLSHGAGRGVDAPDLLALAGALPQQGVSVMLFEQPWHVAGRTVATPPPTLDAGLVAAANALRGRTPLVVGGRSAGARSGARCAKGLGARGVLALSFPLHPPGHPEKTRVGELRGAGLPTLLVQGERDPMGRPEEFPADVPGLEVVIVPEADHGLKVPKRAVVSQEEALGIVVESTLEWLVLHIVGSS